MDSLPADVKSQLEAMQVKSVFIFSSAGDFKYSK